MKVYLSEELITVGDAPVGLLVLRDGTLICKSEYHLSNDGPCECIIVDSGEYYHGEGDKAICHAVVVK
jgi:hypothetical protein